MAAQETQPEETSETGSEKPKLALEVTITQPGACQRHVAVTVPRADIDRYLQNAVKELAPKAQVPGFRTGRAPRNLVEKRFHEQMVDQVKGSLLMDSMTQVTEDHKFAAISEPKFDVDVVKIPEDGPLVFEFDIEVRPDFDVPEWKGLSLERPVHQYSEEEISRQVRTVLAKYGQLQLKEGDVATDDQLTVHVTVRRGDEVLTEFTESGVQVKSNLSFRDARIEGFDGLVIGAKAGDQRSTTVTLGNDVNREDLRGQEVTVDLKIEDIKTLELPKLTNAFLDRIGGFEDESELRDAIRKELERQLRYHQQRRIREQITTQLTRTANWDLPPEMLRRQFQRELERSVLELRASGFSEDEIRAHQNEIRQNNLRSTAMALKEHFILERIAEDHKIDAEPPDYEAEIQLIAAQKDENPRRVRARIEKSGQMDALRNQIVERKVIELITSTAKFKEMPIDLKPHDTFAIDRTVSAIEENAIPEAQHGGEAESLRQPAMRS